MNKVRRRKKHKKREEGRNIRSSIVLSSRRNSPRRSLPFKGCAQVYLEPVHLGWKPLVLSWSESFKKRPGALKKNAKNERKKTHELLKF